MVVRFAQDGLHAVVSGQNVSRIYSTSQDNEPHSLEGCSVSPDNAYSATVKDFGLRFQQVGGENTLDWMRKRNGQPTSNVVFSPKGKSVAFAIGKEVIVLAWD